MNSDVFKTYRVTLTPVSSFTSLPTSDTLFGAICWGIRIIYGEKELEDILSSINDNPKFILSSCFPLVKVGSKEVYFYPRPIRQDIISDDVNKITKDKDKKYTIEIIEKLKKFKKASYVSQEIFNEIQNGKTEKDIFLEHLEGRIVLDNKMLFKKEEFESIFGNAQFKVIEKISLPRNMTDRFTFSTTNGGEIFYSEEYFFSEKVALYFLVKTQDINYLLPIFQYLQDTGIGRDRFLGKGRFKFSFEEKNNLFSNVSTESNSNFFLTLSRYIPNKKNDILTNGKMFYELITYYSKVDSIFEFKGEDVFKDKIIYIKEGSIFETKDKKEYYGFCPIVKVINDKKIYQNGLAFPVFLKLDKKNET